MVLTVVALSANALPAFFLAPLVGRLATKRDPRSVDVLGRVAKIVQMGVIAALAFTGDLSYVMLPVRRLGAGERRRLHRHQRGRDERRSHGVDVRHLLRGAVGDRPAPQRGVPENFGENWLCGFSPTGTHEYEQTPNPEFV